jgi:hypothetical protein
MLQIERVEGFEQGQSRQVTPSESGSDGRRDQTKARESCPPRPSIGATAFVCSACTPPRGASHRGKGLDDCTIPWCDPLRGGEVAVQAHRDVSIALSEPKLEHKILAFSVSDVLESLAERVEYCRGKARRPRIERQDAYGVRSSPCCPSAASGTARAPAREVSRKWRRCILGWCGRRRSRVKCRGAGDRLASRASTPPPALYAGFPSAARGLREISGAVARSGRRTYGT